MTRFAAATEVPVERSRAEIERLVSRYGATGFAYMHATGKAVIVFEMAQRRIMFELPLPRRDDKRFTQSEHRKRMRSPEQALAAWEQACRQAWRALRLVIQAKLEACESGICSFEDEFLAHIVLPDGQTVSQHVRPRIAAIYSGEKMQPLLPGPRPS